MGWLYLLGATVGGSYFIFRSVQLVRDPTVHNAWANFHASLLQLTLLLVAAMLDSYLLG
jgi:protoheme IX farnesyltransferase